MSYEKALLGIPEENTKKRPLPGKVQKWATRGMGQVSDCNISLPLVGEFIVFAGAEVNQE